MCRYLQSGAAGDVIHQAGDVSADMFIIQDGQIELLRTYAGEVSQVALLGPGDFFGEIKMLEGTPRELAACRHRLHPAAHRCRHLQLGRAREPGDRHPYHSEPGAPSGRSPGGRRRGGRHRDGTAKGIPSVANAAPADVAVPASADPRPRRVRPALRCPAGSVVLVHEPSGREFPLFQGFRR